MPSAPEVELPRTGPPASSRRQYVDGALPRTEVEYADGFVPATVTDAETGERALVAVPSLTLTR